MKTLIACLLSLVPALACAEISTQNAWIRSSTGPNGALFLEIENDSPQLETLVSATTHQDQCDHMELHTHKHEDGKMMMRQVSSIEVPAQDKVELKPGGLHIMLMGLKKPLQDGQMVPVSLTFESGETLDLEVPVKSSALTAGHSHH